MARAKAAPKAKVMLPKRVLAVVPTRPPPSTDVGMKPKRQRQRPGVVESSVHKEIGRYQKSTELLIKTAPFVRLIKEIIDKIVGQQEQLRYQKGVMKILQEAAEAFIIELFQYAYKCTIARNHVTLKVQDIRLALELKFNMKMSDQETTIPL